jgi:2-oxoacid:acceptor oxidoreductase gamma subunit (pyruvate/2-ketoisovalerate family)
MLIQKTKLIDVRFHGRAGQGVVTASRLLGEAAILSGKWTHAFPNFGPERMGAPVSAYTRIADEQFFVKTQVYNPDIVVIIDPTLVKEKKYYEGLKEGGTILLNTTSIPPEIKDTIKDFNVWIVDGDRISREYLGRTIANTVMLGALLKVSGLVKPEHIVSVLFKKFSPNIAEKNAAAIKAAYEEVKKVD